MTKEEPKNPKPDHLSRKQLEAIPFLVGARSLEEGRKQARVSKFALYSWLKQEPFRKALEEARGLVIEEALDRLKASVTRAVDVYSEIMDTAESESVRLRAAEGVLSFFLKAKEFGELAGRIKTIEQIVFERRVFAK